MNFPTSEPSEITRGETVVWTKSLPDFPPADGWTLTYYFRGAGAGVDVVATVDGGNYRATMPAAQSKTLAAGRYTVEGWVSKGAGDNLEQHLVVRQTVKVNQGLADVGTDTPVDGRSDVKKTLDAIRAAMASRATAAQLRRSIGNTQIEFMSISELILAETRFQQFYNQEVRRARALKGEPAFRFVRTRFIPPT